MSVRAGRPFTRAWSCGGAFLCAALVSGLAASRTRAEEQPTTAPSATPSAVPPPAPASPLRSFFQQTNRAMTEGIQVPKPVLYNHLIDYVTEAVKEDDAGKLANATGLSAWCKRFAVQLYRGNLPSRRSGTPQSKEAFEAHQAALKVLIKYDLNSGEAAKLPVAQRIQSAAEKGATPEEMALLQKWQAQLAGGQGGAPAGPQHGAAAPGAATSGGHPGQAGAHAGQTAQPAAQGVGPATPDPSLVPPAPRGGPGAPGVPWMDAPLQQDTFTRRTPRSPPK
jgi:hypothetical protein